MSYSYVVWLHMNSKPVIQQLIKHMLMMQHRILQTLIVNTQTLVIHKSVDVS